MSQLRFGGRSSFLFDGIFEGIPIHSRIGTANIVNKRASIKRKKWSGVHVRLTWSSALKVDDGEASQF